MPRQLHSWPAGASFHTFGKLQHHNQIDGDLMSTSAQIQQPLTPQATQKAISEGQQQLTPMRLIQMGWSFILPLAIQTAVRTRIFDVLDERPKTVAQICQETACAHRGVEPLINFLVAIELLRKTADGLYSLTPESSTFLVSSKPSFHGGFICHLATDLIPKFMELENVVRTGHPARSANQEAEGTDFFKNFVEDLMPVNFPAARTLAQHLASNRKTETTKILDIAAGSGVWGLAAAQAFPAATLTAIDYPDVLAVTRSVVSRFGLNGRFHEIAGDVLQVNLGIGYSIATLGHILHSEGEERSRALLHKVYEALAPQGTIAIAEFVLNEDRTSPPAVAGFNLNMAVNTEHGRTFTFSELRQWLEEAGFRSVRTLEVPGPSPLVLADK
jgi:ubiquinone/menaquinone biosynthesis C-methylase UbiE